MARLLESYYENPREIQLFFYYPSDAYISYLMTVPELEFLDEIDCMDLFPGGDSRERVVIFYDSGIKSFVTAKTVWNTKKHELYLTKGRFYEISGNAN